MSWKLVTLGAQSTCNPDVASFSNPKTELRGMNSLVDPAMLHPLSRAASFFAFTLIGCSTVNSQAHYYDRDTGAHAAGCSPNRTLPSPDQFVYGGLVNDAALFSDLLRSSDGQVLLGFLFVTCDMALCLFADSVILPLAVYQQTQVALSPHARLPMSDSTPTDQE